MNAASKTRLFQFMKTIQCRYFRHGQIDGLLRIRSDRDVFIVQRGKTTEADITRIHNLMRGRGSTGSAANKKNKTDLGRYFLLCIPISTFILGTWQIQRRRHKLALIDDLQKRVKSPPVDLPEDLSELESMEYRPVKVRGQFLYDREFTIGPKSLIIEGAGASEATGGVFTAGRSNTGLYVITPFKPEGREYVHTLSACNAFLHRVTILVNRGWVPLKYKKSKNNPIPAHPQSDDVVEITGVVRLNETRPVFAPKNSPESGQWFFRDLEAMSRKAGTAPVYIDLTTKETTRGGPIAGQTRIALRNEHLSYIFTWYSLSAITGWMWHRLYIRKLPLL